MYSRRIPGLRARWLAFNEGVVLGQSSTEFRRCSILRFDTVCSMIKLIRRVSEDARFGLE